MLVAALLFIPSVLPFILSPLLPPPFFSCLDISFSISFFLFLISLSLSLSLSLSSPNLPTHPRNPLLRSRVCVSV